MSPHQARSSSQFPGPNTRFTMLSARASAPAMVVRRVRRRHTPASPAAAISRATRLRPTCTPAVDQLGVDPRRPVGAARLAGGSRAIRSVSSASRRRRRTGDGRARRR